MRIRRAQRGTSKIAVIPEGHLPQSGLNLISHIKRERSAYLGFNRKCYRDYPFLIIMGILISSPKYAHRVPAYFLLGLVPPIDDNDDV
jgi:hypothetical protein